MSIVDDARASLSLSPGRWSQLATGIPAELAGRTPEPGEWSLHQCLQHVVDTEEMMRTRLVAILAEREFPAFDPAADGSIDNPRPMPELAAEFARRREAGLELLGTLSDADLDKRGRHADLGSVTLREFLNEWTAHDLMHVVQAERSLMQPFIAASGPWRGYFTDHDVAPD